MTDNDKTLVERLRDNGSMSHAEVWEAMDEAADRIEAQAAEIERLREALGLADAALRGANMNMNVVERKVAAALIGKAEQ